MDTVLTKTLLLPLCRLLGHNWRYDDYSDCMNEDGEEYGFKTYRKCLRCNQHEFFLPDGFNEKDASPQTYQVAKDY